MKVLTADQMREVDRRTIELGIPGLVLMENAGHRVVEFLAARFAPLEEHRILVLCGKGNNGGDGFVIARQLFTRFRTRSLDVVFAGREEELRGDAAANFRMLSACGCPVAAGISPDMRRATLVLDALLGTGLKGPAAGPVLDLVREVNSGFPEAVVVAVDIPSGMSSDTAASPGEVVSADFTVTFTAPKAGQVLPPNCDKVGELIVGAIGSPPSLYENDPGVWLSLAEAAGFRFLFGARAPGAHKGDFGHVLVIGGSRGKTGAAAMAGIAALRAGAGLVTVASAASAVPAIAAYSPELMTEALPETERGGISPRAFDYGLLGRIAERKTLIALGPGLGDDPETVEFARRVAAELPHPMVIDADGLNALRGTPIGVRGPRVLTPHPGEMSRLLGTGTAEVQRDRLGCARGFAITHSVTLVLKGQRTLTAYPDGRVRVNPTGTPAMATGGSGDILTGLIAGLSAQFPEAADDAVAAGVFLHGRCGEMAARELGEKPVIATDLLTYLPAAMEECAGLQD